MKMVVREMGCREKRDGLRKMMSVAPWRRGDGDGGERSRRWRGWQQLGEEDGGWQRLLRGGDVRWVGWRF
ncbi:hypothetical protein MRB53_018187 [Persea americana]|uniref:Uncharacterized protein n=1 Tax=Persea americana TaxID=3435 RepID=A0ACC2M7W0_PERAE|nr:hypothetical protein MRB53_018187 [Persea americana]